MSEQTLTADLVAALQSAELTYTEVGGSRGDLPPGYHHVVREVPLGVGNQRFARAAEDLFSWQLQRRAGVRVLASSPRVRVGAVAILLLGVGRVAVRAPVRVVYVIDQPHLKGFGYGTLPGHPERGEEAFVVELRPDGAVICRITAFSRPATWLTKLGGPLATQVQSWVTGRYLQSLSG